MKLETNLGIHSAKRIVIKRKASWMEGKYGIATSSLSGVAYRRSKKQRLKTTGIIDRPEDFP
jgi:hypothetical protein